MKVQVLQASEARARESFELDQKRSRITFIREEAEAKEKHQAEVQTRTHEIELLEIKKEISKTKLAKETFKFKAIREGVSKQKKTQVHAITDDVIRYRNKKRKLSVVLQ